MVRLYRRFPTYGLPFSSSLHSIMVRLYHDTRCKFREHYQPLHSIMVRLYHQNSRSEFALLRPLHSIMVRLYPDNRLSVVTEPLLFTFHYGEIISILRSAGALGPCNFTFHYGEIISRSRSRTSYRILPLHSIMVRLYQSGPNLLAA